MYKTFPTYFADENEGEEEESVTDTTIYAETVMYVVPPVQVKDEKQGATPM